MNNKLIFDNNGRVIPKTHNCCVCDKFHSKFVGSTNEWNRNKLEASKWTKVRQAHYIKLVGEYYCVHKRCQDKFKLNPLYYIDE